jgi:hypothetical protein
LSKSGLEKKAAMSIRVAPSECHFDENRRPGEPKILAAIRCMTAPVARRFFYSFGEFSVGKSYAPNEFGKISDGFSTSFSELKRSQKIRNVGESAFVESNQWFSCRSQEVSVRTAETFAHQLGLKHE